MSVVDNTPQGKATGVSPWYGVDLMIRPLNDSAL